MQSKADLLRAVIEASIAADPYLLNGNPWCRLSHRERAFAIGADERTVRRITGAAPYVTTTRRIGEVRTTLVRIGEPSSEDRHREVAHVLTAMWRKHLTANVTPRRAALAAEIEAAKASGDRIALKEAKAKIDRLHGDRETPREFGCFNGLASAWPDGLQAEIFKLVLAEWGDFASAVKLAAIIDPPATGKSYKRDLDDMYLGFPSIPLMALFPSVAVDLLELHYQSNGKAPPAALIAVNPSLWSHLAA